MNKIIVGITTILIIIGGIAWFVSQPKSSGTETEKITVFYSPTCGCCSAYIAYLKQEGYTVEGVQENDLSGVKAKYNIPQHLQSCHTSLVEGYVVEGHIPVGVIKKLLEKKPTIAGIALPGMPSGSPGMPGMKHAPFQIHAISLDGTDAGIFWEF